MSVSSLPEPDRIEVRDLELFSHIGVPDAERAEPQRLTVNITLVPSTAFTGLGDDISRTVDYFALTRRIRQLSAERPRRLIETLVQEIAECCLREFAVRDVAVELRKYILPDTSYVAVHARRSVVR
jgi:dihydroneopterin aldolase